MATMVISPFLMSAAVIGKKGHLSVLISAIFAEFS
jgi:hypothetical protein